MLAGRTVGLILLCDHRPFDGRCPARDMTTDENGSRLALHLGSPNLELTYGVAPEGLPAVMTTWQAVDVKMTIPR